MHLRWQKGGGAFVHALTGDRITLVSTISSAPGSRLDGVLASGGAVRVKVASCRSRTSPASTFTIEGRLIDTTREARAALTALCDAERQSSRTEPDR
jgi:hypothetical protein